MDLLEDYQNVEIKLGVMGTIEDELFDSLSSVTTTQAVNEAMLNITTSLDIIATFVQENIARLQSEEAVQSFLDELKVLFVKYQATVEVVDVTTGAGYGDNYGGELANGAGIKFTATDSDGVVGSKVFDKTTLTQEDF